MKTLKVSYAPRLDGTDIRFAAQYFEQHETYEYVDMLNWPTEYPYKPDCRFKIARSSDALYLFFKVVENNVKATYTNDNDPVWQDSCVEFFFQGPNQKTYNNFELNCIGTCLAAERAGREEGVVMFGPEKMSRIKRYATLGDQPFNEIKAGFEWKLTFAIPFDLLGLDKNNLPERVKANFYKCADGTSNPHYLSWSLISTKQPDFHRPEFFGDLIFVK